MKFAHTLSLNSNPDWAKHYIDFAGLKKVVNVIKQQEQHHQNQKDTSRDISTHHKHHYNQQQTDGNQYDSIIEENQRKAREVFLSQLTPMIIGVRNFYDAKKAELDAEMARLQPLLEEKQRILSRTSLSSLHDKSNDYYPHKTTNVETTSLLHRADTIEEMVAITTTPKQRIMKSRSTVFEHGEIVVDKEGQRREICDLYIQYNSLKQFGELNCTAVRKIIKKYDKTIFYGEKLTQTHLSSLQLLLPFWVETDDNNPIHHDPMTSTKSNNSIDASMELLLSYFAHFYCNDNAQEAQRQLQLMIREVITFQRHSVWLDVIEDQRKMDSTTISKQLVSIDTTVSATNTSSMTVFGIVDDGSSVYLPKVLSPWMKAGRIIMGLSPQKLSGLVSIMLFLTILLWPTKLFPIDHHQISNASSTDSILNDHETTKRNALALFVLVSILWAAETVPLFVASMLVPFLSVLLRVITVDDIRLDAVSASKHVFGTMFSHVIMLLLGGFTIAAALSKYNIAQMVATSISRHCGTDTRTVVLVNMFVATVSSMWISNVAAPVLCYSLITPILKASTANTSRAAFGSEQCMSCDSDHKMCQALVMGIALASNVGGMASPISSPQNLFAIEYTPIGWLAWFIVSIPLCITLDIIIWIWLVVCYRLPAATESAAVRYSLQQHITSGGSRKEALTMEQYIVIVVSIGTVLLWCASANLSQCTGQMGILGIVPFCIFFGTGLLTKDDLNSFLWSVVILAMGGLVLGEAIRTSGLLNVFAETIASFIEHQEFSLWITVCIFCTLILVCTTFVSHTVGAIVILPIVSAVGAQMRPTSHAKELVFISALACSAAMGLPVSGFPNMTAVSVEDRLGNRYLTAHDFLRYAVPASVMSLLVIVTLGYWLVLIAAQF